MTALLTRPVDDPGRSAGALRRGLGRGGLVPLVAANALSGIANVLVAVAVPWLVLTTTGSAVLVGTVVLGGAAGATVGGLVAGRAVDLLGPRAASAAADLLSAAAVVPILALVWPGTPETWQLLTLVALGTLGDATGSAARQGMVPAVADAGGVRRERANGLVTSAEHVGYVLGAPLAGILLAVLGTGAALTAAVAGFLLAAGCVGVVTAPVPGPTAQGHTEGSVREALATIWADPALRALVVFPTTAVLFVGPLSQVVLPVLARRVFDDPVVLGVLLAAYGAGGLAGAVGYGAIGHRLGRRALYRGVFVAWPVAYAAVLLVPRLPGVLGALAVLGTAAGALVPLQATVRQERAPARLLPRVVALSAGTVPVAVPTAAVATGAMIDGLGLGLAAWLLAAGALLLGAVVLVSPWTRELGGGAGTGTRRTS